MITGTLIRGEKIDSSDYRSMMKLSKKKGTNDLSRLTRVVNDDPSFRTRIVRCRACEN